VTGAGRQNVQISQMAGAQGVSRSVAAPAISQVVARSAGPSAEVASLPAGSHVMVPRIGLHLTRRLTFEAWADIGKQLSAVMASSAWCLGDWLAYGQDVYRSRYREAVERTGLDYQTLRNYAWVARRFELSRRRDTLSFGHHAEVASLPAPEQDFWLRKAEQFGWPTNHLRREVRTSLRERDDGVESAHPGGSDGVGQAGLDEPRKRFQVIEIRLTPKQSELCEQAASREGLPLPAGVAHILDRATRGDLLQRLKLLTGSNSALRRASRRRR
jgi:hypothetical protein